MSKFRKKPVVIDAVCWNGCTVGLTDRPFMDDGARLEMPSWMPTAELVPDLTFMEPIQNGKVMRHDDDLYIGTLEGWMKASPGDWIIRGIAGELYPCKPGIFAATYEAVTGACDP